MKKPDIIIPAPGQESVWDYPRPPRLDDVDDVLKIVFNDVVIAETRRAKRVLETSHPPVYYFPPQDIQVQYLDITFGRSFCEWKGTARFYDLNVSGKRLEKVGWYYPDPTEPFKSIKNYVAFYACPMDACYVGSEKVIPQPGNFYGGWITKNIVGPFKGEPGTMLW